MTLTYDPEPSALALGRVAHVDSRDLLPLRLSHPGHQQQTVKPQEEKVWRRLQPRSSILTEPCGCHGTCSQCSVVHLPLPRPSPPASDAFPSPRSRRLFPFFAFLVTFRFSSSIHYFPRCYCHSCCYTCIQFTSSLCRVLRLIRVHHPPCTSPTL